MRNKSTRKCIKRGWLLLLAILLPSAQSSFADTYSFDLTGDLSIWDISGSYDDTSLGFSLNISYDLTQDTAGKFTGGGNASCTILGTDVDMEFTIKGSVKQKGGDATVKMTMKFTGTADDGVDTYKFKANAKVTAEINSIDGTIDGTVKVRISISGYGSESGEVLYIEDLPVDMDGTFTLELDVTEDAKGKLLGTGTLTLSNGDTYNFSVTGKYKAKTDESKLTLKGDDSSKKCKFKIVINEGDGQMTYLNGKALGQKLKETW